MADVVCKDPSCTGGGAPQIAGSQYCEYCGGDLGSSSAPASNTLCPKCLNAYTPGDAICSVCGAALAGGGGAQLAAPPPPPPPPPQSHAAPPPPPSPPSGGGGGVQPGEVKLVITQGKDLNRQYLLDQPTMVVGRLDSDSNNYPDLDLEDQDTEYVHRKHATLTFEGGTLMVCHHGSVNPTLINNQPVPLNEKRQLNVGDRLKIGKVVLQLKAC